MTRAPEEIPPDNARCQRTDGKQWRCQERRFQDEPSCEKHLLCYSRNRKKSTSQSSDSTNDSRVSVYDSLMGGGWDVTVSRKKRGGDGSSYPGEDVIEEKTLVNKDAEGCRSHVENIDGDKGEEKADAGLENEENDNVVKMTKTKGLRTKTRVVASIVASGDNGGDAKDGREGEKKEESKRRCQKLKEKAKLPTKTAKKEETDSDYNLEIEVKGERANIPGESVNIGKSVSRMKKARSQITQEKMSMYMKREEKDEESSDNSSQSKGSSLRKRKSGETIQIPGVVRRKYISDDPNDRYQMCHQCMRSDRKVVRCNQCHGRRYCYPCIDRWYANLSEEDIAEACPCCRQNCNCKACLRRVNLPKSVYSGIPEDNGEKIRFFKYLISQLLPFIEQFSRDQMMEKDMEAKISGLSPLDLKIEKINYSLDERIYCNNCSTSIVDFHRSCPNCLYDLCLTCCREIREGCLRVCDKEVVIQYSDRGQKYLHGTLPTKLKNRPTSLSGSGSNFRSEQMSLPEWKTTESGNIPCPPKERGGCGHEKLELKCIFSENWVSGLKENAENLDAALPTEVSKCLCLEFNEDDNIADGQLRKAAYRSSGNNHLYCPLASEAQPGGLDHFQRHWIMGEPIIVRDVLKLTSGLSWDPMVMWRAFREILVKKGSSDLIVTAVDCLDSCEIGHAKGQEGQIILYLHG